MMASKSQSSEELLERLVSGQQTVAVLFGEDRYRLERFVQKMGEQLFAPEQREFAWITYDLREQSLDHAMDDAETMPWLSERKLIVIRSAYFLTGSTAAKDSVSQDALNRLLAYLQTPNPSTMLVIEVSEGKLDERKKIVKWIKDRGWMVSFAPLKPDEIKYWLEQQVRDRRLRIDGEALKVLQSRCGADLQLLQMELEKCELYLHDQRQSIGIYEMEQLVAQPLEDDLFAFSNALIQGKWAICAAIMHDLVMQKIEPFSMVMTSVSQVRLLLLVKDAMKQGYSSHQLAGKLAQSPYRVQLAMESAKSLSIQKISGLLNRCIQAEKDLRQTGSEKRAVMERMILDCANISG